MANAPTVSFAESFVDLTAASVLSNPAASVLPTFLLIWPHQSLSMIHTVPTGRSRASGLGTREKTYRVGSLLDGVGEGFAPRKSRAQRTEAETVGADA